MTPVLYYAHSGFRYLVLILGVLALGWALFGLFTRRPYDRTMRILGAAFAGSLHLQLLLGLALLFTGRFQPQLIGHIVMVVFAAAAAQLVPSVMRRRPPEARSYGPHVVATAVALALLAGGIVAIGRGVFQSTAPGLGS